VAKNELISLALIYDAPKHAYALNSIIKDIGLEHWAKISRASIYNCLSRLQKQRCVKVSTVQVGNMPPRKVYAITAKGKKRLHDEQVAALRSVAEPDSMFPLAVTFLFGMQAKEAIQHCRARIGDLKGVVKHLDEEHGEYEGCEIDVALIVINAARKHIQAEIESTKNLIALLSKKPAYYNELLKRMKEYYNY
jgi:DNA-binding PadR family transcriptional regulator